MSERTFRIASFTRRFLPPPLVTGNHDLSVRAQELDLMSELVVERLNQALGRPGDVASSAAGACIWRTGRGARR